MDKNRIYKCSVVTEPVPEKAGYQEIQRRKMALSDHRGRKETFDNDIINRQVMLFRHNIGY